MIAQFIQHRPAKRRLARADFARELDESLPLANAVKQMIKRFAMLRAVKQEPRVRRDRERRFVQPVIFQIHNNSLLSGLSAVQRKRLSGLLRGKWHGGRHWARIRRAALTNAAASAAVPMLIRKKPFTRAESNQRTRIFCCRN